MWNIRLRSPKPEQQMAATAIGGRHRMSSRTRLGFSSRSSPRSPLQLPPHRHLHTPRLSIPLALLPSFPAFEPLRNAILTSHPHHHSSLRIHRSPAHIRRISGPRLLHTPILPSPCQTRSGLCNRWNARTGACEVGYSLHPEPGHLRSCRARYGFCCSRRYPRRTL